MSDELEQPTKLEDNGRNPDGTYKMGHAQSSPGRPKGKGLKEYDREKFAKMTDEEKEDWLKSISKELRYRMAEGNPAQDVTTAGKELPAPIYVHRDDSAEEDQPPQEEN